MSPRHSIPLTASDSELLKARAREEHMSVAAFGQILLTRALQAEYYDSSLTKDLDRVERRLIVVEFLLGQIISVASSEDVLNEILQEADRMADFKIKNRNQL